MPATDVILIPAHNRRATTLDALRALATHEVLSWATVVVIDDGSEDGTSEAVQRDFPRTVLLRGDGTWWWGGAIRRGMEWATGAGAERIFWLNDDCRPPAGALRRLRDRVLATGTVMWIDARAPSGWSYGAHVKTAWRVRRCTPEEEGAGKFDTFSGNCVCLPRRVVDRVGFVHDHRFPHGLGDLDYGLRLARAGFKAAPLSKAIAENAEPSAAASESWMVTNRPMRTIWREFSSPRSFLYFPAWRHFAVRHWGILWGPVVFAAPYARWAAIAMLRTLLPTLARRIGRGRALRSSSVPGSRPG